MRGLRFKPSIILVSAGVGTSGFEDLRQAAEKAVIEFYGCKSTMWSQFASLPDEESVRAIVDGLFPRRSFESSIRGLSVSMSELRSSIVAIKLTQNVKRTCRCKAYESCYRCLKPRAQGGGKKCRVVMCS